MRANYNAHGVSGYYEKVSESYRNPHFLGVVDGCFHAMNAWHASQAAAQAGPGQSGDVTSQAGDTLRVLDLACGSGEATLAVLRWHRHRLSQSAHSAAPNASAHDSQPAAHGCNRVPCNIEIAACDPYTQQAYQQRTKRFCAPVSFEDVAAGVLLDDPLSLQPAATDSQADGDQHSSQPCEPDSQGKLFDIVVCSFAAHLVQASMLKCVMVQLSLAAHTLIILSPHKQPQIGTEHGWQLASAHKCSMRVHARRYASLM